MVKGREGWSKEGEGSKWTRVRGGGLRRGDSVLGSVLRGSVGGIRSSSWVGQSEGPSKTEDGRAGGKYMRGCGEIYWKGGSGCLLQVQ